MINGAKVPSSDGVKVVDKLKQGVFGQGMGLSAGGLDKTSTDSVVPVDGGERPHDPVADGASTVMPGWPAYVLQRFIAPGFIALAVFLAMLLAAATLTSPAVQRTSLENIEAQRLSVISTGIRNLYASENNFNGLSNQLLLAGKIIPDDMPVKGSSLRNSWQGSVEVGAASDPSMYAITYSGVPANACLKLGTGFGATFKALTINGTVIFARENGPEAHSDSRIVNPVEVAAACQLDPKGSSMVFMGS